MLWVFSLPTNVSKCSEMQIHSAEMKGGGFCFLFLSRETSPCSQAGPAHNLGKVERLPSEPSQGKAAGLGSLGSPGWQEQARLKSSLRRWCWGVCSSRVPGDRFVAVERSCSPPAGRQEHGFVHGSFWCRQLRTAAGMLSRRVGLATGPPAP